jgi:hypothetical protein
MDRPRPEGFDYNTPDDESLRCTSCNPDGMNRTGLKEHGYVGALSTYMYADYCPARCSYGLKKGL